MVPRARAAEVRADRIASLVVVAGFSLGLGIATVAIPLLALEAGYDAAAVGFLVAVSAASQLTARIVLPWLLGLIPDRTIITVGAAAMAAAFALLSVSTALPAFILAQLLQGAARGLLWTCSQTHVIRGDGGQVRRLVDMSVAGYAGTLTGPALGGMLAAGSLTLALVTAAAGCVVAVAASLFMRALPPFDRRAGVGIGRLLRRDGMAIACWASVVGGGWWSIVGSYVPVVGVSVGLGSIAIGWLITASESAGMIALIAQRRIPRARVRPVLLATSLLTVAALAGLAIVSLVGPAAIIGFVLLMLVGGAASGIVSTLAPAIASFAASSAEQGDALALSGTFRAAALLSAPASVGALLAVTGLGGALAIMAAGLGVPGLFIASRRAAAPGPDAAGTGP